MLGQVVRACRPVARWRRFALAASVWLAASACSNAHDLDKTSVATPPTFSGLPAGTAGIGGLAGAGAGGTGAAPVDTGPGASGTGGAGVLPVGTGAAAAPGALPMATSGTAAAAAGPVSHDVSACMPCQSSMGFTGTLEACCTAAGRCGLDVSSLTGESMCAEQNAPGTQTMACPSTSVMGFLSLPGCCRPDGTCGFVIDQIAPLGCVDSASVAKSLGMAAGTVTPCTEIPAQVQGVK